MYFKIFNENDKHHGYQYKDGINVDKVPFNDDPYDTCVKGGFYFTDVANICEFLTYGDYIREVIPQGEMIKNDNKWRCHSLDLKARKPLNELNTWKWMIEQGVDITTYDNYAIQWASCNDHLEVVKFLVSQGADITVYNHHAVRWASGNGNLEMVKYLVEQGADITACDNHAVQWTSQNGHLEVVKYLVEQGADITADNNCAFKWALLNNHTEVVEYLEGLTHD